MRGWVIAALVIVVAVGLVPFAQPGQEAVAPPIQTVASFDFEAPRNLPPCDLSGETRGCARVREPTFDIGPEGEIWATGAGGVPYTSQVWLSPDLGDTWRHVGLQGSDAGRHSIGFEGDVAVDPRGMAYVFDTNLYQGWWTTFEDPDLPANAVPFAQAEFAGMPALPVPDSFDRPWLLSLGPGEVMFTYNNGATAYRITRDGGLTWSPAVTVSQCHIGTPLHLGDEWFAFVSACPGGIVDPVAGNVPASAPQLFLPKARVEPDLLRHEVDNWAADPIVTPVHDGSGTPVAREALVIMDLAEHHGRWFVVGADAPEVRAYLSVRDTSGGWTTEWLGPGGSYYPAVDARADGLVGVAYLSEENGVWAVRAELRDPSGALLASTLVDAGPVSNDPRSRDVGDFIDVDWLPDGRFMVMYGAKDADALIEAESGIRYARSAPVPAKDAETGQDGVVDVSTADASGGAAGRVHPDALGSIKMP